MTTYVSGVPQLCTEERCYTDAHGHRNHDELDKLESHLNKELPLLDWHGIRVYEPEPQENGEIIRHLRKNPSDKLKNKIPIGIYEGHALLIKDNKIPKLYACVNFQVRSAKGSQE